MQAQHQVQEVKGAVGRWWMASQMQMRERVAGGGDRLPMTGCE